MGLLGLFKKKPKKNFATLDEVRDLPEDVEISDKPLSRDEIHELDTGEAPGDVAADAGAAGTETATGDASSGASAEGMFEMGSGFGEGSEYSEGSGEEPGADTGTEIGMKLEDAMQMAQKYLIVHAQIPNGMLPKKSSKRENGTFYFEFQDRELHRIELDGKGEVMDWEREKL